jgi:hypothetical protein
MKYGELQKQKIKQVCDKLDKIVDNYNREKYMNNSIMVNKGSFSPTTHQWNSKPFIAIDAHLVHVFEEDFLTKYKKYQNLKKEVENVCIEEDVLFKISGNTLFVVFDFKENPNEYVVGEIFESFNAFASEEDYISLNESLNLRPALNKIKNICARLQKEFGLDCYATEDEVTFNNDDDIMSNLVVGKKYNSLKQYLVNVIQIMKLCGRKIMFNTQYDYNSILI